MEPLTRLLHRLRRLTPSPASDAALLARFVLDRDEAAFAALVERHGPMVLAACKRVLGDAHAAEDAFQATFLVLARKAGAVGRPDALAGWLYGVACRVALKSRSARRSVQPLPEDTELWDLRAGPLAEATAREGVAVVDEEIQRLPEVYRLPVLLCCLEGLSQEEASRRLGWSPGSVKGRLERGRARLQARLARRGLTLAAVLASVDAMKGLVSARLSARLTETAVQAALAFLTRTGSSSGVVALAQGVLHAMFMSKLQASVVVVAVVGLLGAGIGWLANGPGTNPPAGVPSARAEEPGGKTKPPAADEEKAGRLRQLEQAKEEMDRFAKEMEAMDAMLSAEIVEAMERMVELEEQLHVMETDPPAGPSARETELRKEATVLETQIERMHETMKVDAAPTKNSLEIIQKRLGVVRQQLRNGENERFKARDVRTKDRINLLKRQVRLKEEIRRLEHKRSLLRDEAERRKDAIARRMAMLEGNPPAGTADRSLNAVERRLDAILRELADLRREVQRLQTERKK